MTERRKRGGELGVDPESMGSPFPLLYLVPVVFVTVLLIILKPASLVACRTVFLRLPLLGSCYNYYLFTVLFLCLFTYYNSMNNH